MKDIQIGHFHVGFDDEVQRKVLLPTSVIFMSKFSGKGQYIFVENQSLHRIEKISGSFNDNYALDFIHVENQLYQATVNVSEIENLERLNHYTIQIEYRLVNEQETHFKNIEGEIEIP